MVYPQGQVLTELLSNESGICVFKAIVNDDEGRNLATGTAYEKEGSSFINKTSYMENCETSAVGRALGLAGFGIDTSIASAEEVANAIQQQGEDITINKIMETSLREVIKNNDIPNQKVLDILDDFGYEKLAEIRVKDLKIIQEKLVGD